MNINDLYLMLTTGHIRLPYWFIAITIFAFFMLSLVLLVVWMQKRKYNRLYISTNGKLKKAKLEMSGIASKLGQKEEEAVVLNKSKSTINKKLVEKEKEIKTLNESISILQDSLDEKTNKYHSCESEKVKLISKLKAIEEESAKLKKSMALANANIQQDKEEKYLLQKQIESTLEILSQKNKLIDIIEEKYKQAISQNEELELSKKTLEKDVDDLREKRQHLINIHESEIKKLNLKSERRVKEIEQLNDSLSQINRKLKAVLNEKMQLEKTLENIQKEQMEKQQVMHLDKSQNIIEKFAKW